MTRVVIRADASVQIGSGHVMRCLTLADELQRRGAAVTFVCREQPGNLSAAIAEKGHTVIRLPQPEGGFTPRDGDVAHAAWLGVPWEQDTRETAAALGPTRYDWLVVDHYALDRRWETLLRPHADRIMAIDDLADRPHDCDLLLDQNLYRDMDKRYDGLVPTGCTTLLGPRYALLRREFVEARKTLRQRDGVVRNLLVFFGSSDPGNQTEKALEAIKRAACACSRIDVVMGSINPNRSRIESVCAELNNTVVHCDTKDMAHLMSEADLCLGSGGSSSWERCALGVPSVVMSIASNQDELSDWGARCGLYQFLGRAASVPVDTLASAVKVAMASPAMLAHFADAGMLLVDGKGVQRVTQQLCPPRIVIRQATLEDCDAVYAWRNAEETRRYIFNAEEIPIETHRSWYTATLTRDDRILLIGEVDGAPVGVVRYDFHDDEALISVYLVPGGQGQGVGTHLIRSGSQWVRKHRPGIRRVVAEVMQENVASMRAFEAAGFTEHHRTLHEVLQ